MTEPAVPAGAPVSPVQVPARHVQRPLLLLARRAWGLFRTKLGVALVLLLVLLALIGPYFAPHSSTEFVDIPYALPSQLAAAGTDSLGHDVLSRFLDGGRSVLGLAAAATALGLALGVFVGLTAAYARSLLDDVLMRSMDVILAFPSIVLALVLVATVGPKLWLLVVAVGLTTAPRVARIVRGAAAEVVERDFVSAADAIGESRPRILFGEILPNITSPLLVEASLRLTYSIGLIAGLSFLGFGVQAPRADWGLMINENRQGLTIQPWGVLLPVIAIGLLTIGTSLIGDGLARVSAGIDRGKDV